MSRATRPNGDAARRVPASPLANVVFATAMVLTAAVLFGAITGRWRMVPVLSGSMAPTLHAGDLALVVRQPVADVTADQVILYRIPIGDRHLQMHRVIDVTHGPDGTDVVTRGDANVTADPWIARLQGSSVWRVSFRVPWVGAAVLFLGRTDVRIACLFLGTALVLAIGLRRIWRTPPIVADRSPGANDAGS